MENYKNLDVNIPVTSLTEWENIFYKGFKNKHWVDNRSAKETAKHWVNSIPIEFRGILNGFDLEYTFCSPEHVSKLDNYQGNSRNHDLLIIAENKLKEKFVISIESKVDESFGQKIGSYLKSIKNKKEKGKKSNVDLRIDQLKQAIFPELLQAEFESLKYQLLTAIAGTLSEAKMQNAKKAVFLVQTFIHSSIVKNKHALNLRDFNLFLASLNPDKVNTSQDGDIYGPFTFKGNDFIPNDVELWIGKYSINI